MAGITLQNIVKIYSHGQKPAVDGFSLEINDGEFLVLVGPSGCGKSTVLRMIAGLEDVTSGSISIAGRDVSRLAPKDRDIAMVFQNYALYPHMTVKENMAFGLKLRKTPKQEIEQRITDAANALGLSEYLQRLPKALSGGQRQRVALGRAIVRNPAVFLFDEPLSNLDAKMRVEMRAEIIRLHAKLHSTMVYVTHDQTEAMTMGTRITVMNEGRIQQTAPPLELYSRPANTFVASFTGTPPMNLLPPGTVKENRITGLRPEHLNFKKEGTRLPFRPTVDIVEPLGSETIVHLALNGADARISVRLPPGETAPARGTVCDLFADMSKARFFDPHSGMSTDV